MTFVGLVQGLFSTLVSSGSICDLFRHGATIFDLLIPKVDQFILCPIDYLCIKIGSHF